MKISLITDIHLGDYRRNDEHDFKKLNCLLEELHRNNSDVLINLADTVSKDEYLRKDIKKHDVWKQYLQFREKANIDFIEVGLYRENDFFAQMFNLENICYTVDINNCRFISICPELDGDHQMTYPQKEWVEKQFQNLNGKILFVLSHVPVEQSTDRFPSPGVYLTDSEFLKDLSKKSGAYTIFAGGHFHTMVPPKYENNICMLMGGVADYLDSENNILSIRHLEIEPNIITLNTVNIDLYNNERQEDSVIRIM